jgi:hypothetical protein
MFSSTRNLIRTGLPHLPGADPRRLALPLLLDQGPIPGHIIQRLQDRLQRDLIFPSEFFGSERIRAVDLLIDHRGADPSALEP